ncbi:MAG: hypothetical protein B6244_09815 [Candidatus Cloacimonetes bacterium 4572_55]|nr:MAG: hypothetical protein B6244_09815 [Candidatus Cloacimonetes bacterium 4572_55]
MPIYLEQMLSNAYVDLSFGPTWPYVRVVREFIESFCRVSFEEHYHDMSERISSSASELVENAVKYSARDGDRQGTRVKVELVHKTNTVVLEVQNHTEARYLESLQQKIEYLNNLTPDQLQVLYHRRMLEASEDGSKSALGLIRILREWRADSLEMIKEPDRLAEDFPHFTEEDKKIKISIKASFKLGRRSGINE